MTRSRTQTLDPAPAAGYRGTFAVDDPEPVAGQLLPPAWEGVYFPFDVPLADLRPDGTPAEDGVLPVIDLPRRMYAGEDTEFLRALRIGESVTRTSRPGTITEKTGRSGRLVFADTVSEYAVDGEVAIRSSWHDVFLEATRPDAPDRRPEQDSETAAAADWVEQILVDARQLFRFSALTFNTHLIHYDRGWAREREGLPDLLVHGPLTRILIMDAARRRHPRRIAARLSVRSIAPALVDRRLRLAGRDSGPSTEVTLLDSQDRILATAAVSWDVPDAGIRDGD